MAGGMQKVKDIIRMKTKLTRTAQVVLVLRITDNRDRATRKPPRVYKLVDGFPDTSTWVHLLWKNEII